MNFDELQAYLLNYGSVRRPSWPDGDHICYTMDENLNKELTYVSSTSKTQYYFTSDDIEAGDWVEAE